MKITNSYIFLKRKENKVTSKSSKNAHRIRIAMSPSFFKLLESTFDNVKQITDSSLSQINSQGTFEVDYNGKKVICNYVYQFVYSTCYLDISVNLSKEISIEVLDIVNLKLIDLKGELNKYYISIISYDSVSEFYCNKLYPFFNEFERKLRNLLFLIYTTNFSLNYYLSTTSKELQDKISKRTKEINKDFVNYSKDEAKIRYAFYALTYSDIENLLFTEHVLDDDQIYLKQFIKDDVDLSTLSEEQIRSIIDKGIIKSDWDIYFGDKFSNDFKSVLSDLHKYRNIIAHCKFVTKTQYNECLKNVKEAIKTVEMAIQLTQENDFKSKNVTYVAGSITAFLKSLTEILHPVMDNITAINNTLSDTAKLVSNLSRIPTSIFQNDITNNILLDDDEENVKNTNKDIDNISQESTNSNN